MRRISIDHAFFWSRDFVMREWRLLLPVALAFFALPVLAVDLILPMPAVPAGQTADLAQMEALLASAVPRTLVMLIAGLVGTLTITAMVLIPRVSVKEAIGIGFRRAPAQLGAGLLVGAGVLTVAILLGMVAVFARMPMLSSQALLAGVIVGAGFVLSVRLVMLPALLVDRGLGPISGLREAWLLTRGSALRLVGALALFIVGALVITLALQSALGALILLAGNMTGQTELATGLTALISALSGAVVSGGLSILIAALYRQLVASRGI